MKSMDIVDLRCDFFCCEFLPVRNRVLVIDRKTVQVLEVVIWSPVTLVWLGTMCGGISCSLMSE